MTNVKNPAEKFAGFFVFWKLVLHAADDVAEACGFLEVKACGGFLHLAFEVFEFGLLGTGLLAWIATLRSQ